MRRARESFQGPGCRRRRVQGDGPSARRGPRVLRMGSVRPMVRRGLFACGMAVRRLHDRRVRSPRGVRPHLPGLHPHVHPLGPHRLHRRGQGRVVRVASPTRVRLAGKQTAFALLPLLRLRMGRGERLHRRDLDVVRLQLTLGWPDAFHTPPGSPINYYLVPSILLICFLQGFFATAGHRAIRYLNWASTVALVALGVYASYIVMKDFDFGQLWAYRPAQPLSFTFTAGALGTGFTYTLTFPLLLDLLIAYNWTWEFIGDFSRFARSKKAGTWGPFAGASLAQYWFFSVGALMTVAFLVTAPPGSVNFAAISDPSYKATQLGFGLGAYLIILFATISTNAGNIYASALGISNIATRWKTSMRRLLLLSAVIVVPLALLPLFETNFVFTYIFFLDFLGAIVVPLWTLTLVDYFLVKARRYSDDLFAQQGGHYWYRGGWNWPAVVTLLSGTALYWIIAFGFPTLRETISAALPTIVFVVVVYYFWGRSAWEKHLRALREARLVEATG